MSYRKYLLGLIMISTLSLMSCSIFTVETEAIDTSFSEIESSCNQSSEIGLVYDVTPMSIDFTFEELLEKIGVMLDADVVSIFNTDYDEALYAVDIDNHHLVCVKDYSEFLSGLTANDPTTGTPLYYPLEEENHQVRRFKIDGICIDEYESEYWAEMSFRRISDIYVDSTSSEDNIEIAGYCFVIDDSIEESPVFYAAYLIGNCTITFQYPYSNNVDRYVSYLEVCEELGLPVNNQITEDIIGV